MEIEDVNSEGTNKLIKFGKIKTAVGEDDETDVLQEEMRIQESPNGDLSPRLQMFYRSQPHS